MTSTTTNETGSAGRTARRAPGARVVEEVTRLVQPVLEAAGRDLPQAESDAHRASYVRRVLSDEGDLAPDA